MAQKLQRTSVAVQFLSNRMSKTMTRCPRFVRLRLVELSENSSMISRARPRSHARKGVPILISAITIPE